MLTQCSELLRDSAATANAIADLVRTEFNAPNTARRIEFATEEYVRKIETAANIVWNLPESLLEKKRR